MEQETLQILNNFGVMGLWGVILYQVLDLVGILSVFTLIGFGIKK